MFNPLGPFYSFQFVLLLGCAVLFYKAAELEGESEILWTGLSVGVFALTWFGMHWSYPGNLMGQALLFAAITLHRVWRDQRKQS